jgi:Na+/melibiose symporter-like transporter
MISQPIKRLFSQIGQLLVAFLAGMVIQGSQQSDQDAGQSAQEDERW